MTVVTEKTAETEKVEREVTETDFETVETTVQKIKCDCCGQKWAEDDDMDMKEIVVDPTAEAVVEERIDSNRNAHQTKQESLEEQLYEYVKGFEIEVPNPEHNASDMLHRNERTEKSVYGTIVEARQYREDSMDMGFGSVDRYHRSMGFHLEIPIQGTEKHMCENCYEGVFHA